MTDLLAGRAQMGTSLGIGLPVLIAAAHFAGLAATTRSGSASPSRSSGRSPLIVIGVVSGIVVSVELTLLWPRFMEEAGPVMPSVLDRDLRLLLRGELPLPLLLRPRPPLPGSTGPP